MNILNAPSIKLSKLSPAGFPIESKLVGPITPLLSNIESYTIVVAGYPVVVLFIYKLYYYGVAAFRLRKFENVVVQGILANIVGTVFERTPYPKTLP